MNLPVDAASYLSNILFLVFLVGIPVYGHFRGVKVYECFIQGAGEGFEIGVRLIPYLVAILVAVGMFRASGAMELISSLVPGVIKEWGITSEIIALGLIRPLSGGASLGILGEIINTHGADSFQARLGAVILGSTETTFYIIAVYFGAVAVTRVRYAVHAGLLADAAGFIAAVIISLFFFR
jgi:spore maturation protein B